jgi:phage baseplate assembly protein W
MALYKGFSTFEFQRRKTFKVNDIELVKLDLLNHIFTLRGTRLMMSEFGTQIPELVFEPMDAELIQTIEQEVIEVINFDPRVELIEIQTLPDYSVRSLKVAARVLYVELNTVDSLELNIQMS